MTAADRQWLDELLAGGTPGPLPGSSPASGGWAGPLALLLFLVWILFGTHVEQRVKSEEVAIEEVVEG